MNTTELLRQRQARLAAMTPAERQAMHAEPPRRHPRQYRGKARQPDSECELLAKVARMMDVEFTAEELCVKAFLDYPDQFSFYARTAYWPDLHKIRYLLSAKSGPVRRGLIRRVRPGVYAAVDASST